MTIEKLKGDIAGLGALDGAVASVCIAAKIGGQTSLHRLQLTDDLASEFLAMAKKKLAELASDVEEQECDLVSYEASNPQAAHEIEVFEPADGSTQKTIATSLGDLAQVGAFAGDLRVIKNLKFYVTVIQRPGLTPVLLFRSYSKTREISRSKLVALLQDGVFDKVNDPVFVFDERVDCIWIDGQMLIYNKQSYQRIFDFFEEVQKAADVTLARIAQAIPMANADAFNADCKSNTVVLTKLKSIAGQPYLDKLTIAILEKEITDRKLGIKLEGKGKDRRIVYEKISRWKILRLLDDGYLSSRATGLDYEATAKRPMA